MLETFLFGVFPYVATVVMVVGLIWRYTTNQFSYSTVSSQFLENRQLFWGSVPWHYGIILVLLAHLVGVVFPDGVQAVNGVPLRLYILEGTAFALSLTLLVGLIVLMLRRGISANVRVMTSPMDVVLLFVLLAQVVTGIITAVFYRWGSAWFIQTATPYFWSLFTLSPKVEYMTALPLLSKLHAINFFILVALFPFSRLVHMLSVPLAYLWRPYQIVMWHRRQTRDRVSGL
ncbi:MAG: respiratory nitrate reductase subunit gamma [Chloroflexi bacterium]|nr:respiratory nitrate reductase subunit gamma [Chloroflexota bacterium]MBI2980553.1 respiratory nitrate reductase subunit gamma [Chloroflexota bacterium]